VFLSGWEQQLQRRVLPGVQTMTRLIRMFVLACTFLALTGCGAEEAPVGRGEGFSESADWIVAVRLQVDKGNVIHATALSIQVKDTTLPERLSLTNKIKRMLPREWEHAVRGKVDFRNNILRRAGGVAPLFVFKPADRTMTFNFYAGGKLTKHVRLHPVKNFMVAGSP
jgi:hypothetical protein